MALREPLLGPPDACNESEHVHSQHAQHGAASSSSVDQRDDCEALLKLNGAHVSIEEDIEIPPKSTFWPCVFNLSKVIMGAGMMAIPQAFYLVGFPLGVCIMLIVAGLTAFTLMGLVRGSELTGTCTYSSLTRQALGGTAEAVLQCSVFVNCWVMNVVFVVVFGDILVGEPGTCDGLICELTGITSGPLADRRAVLAIVSFAVLAPLASMRDMQRLAVVNIAGVVANAVFAAATVALAGAALARGTGHVLPLTPDWDALSGGSTSGVLVAMGLASILPILLNCDVCHQSLHPLMPVLRPYSGGAMNGVIGFALTVCNTLYLTIALGCCLAFGPALRPDVLSNINTGEMAPLLGAAPALAVTLAVRFGYLLSLVGSFVLLCFPQRDVVTELAAGRGSLAAQLSDGRWAGLSWLLVASQFSVAVFVPSIWGLLSLVGSTASTMQAFIIPGCIILALEPHNGGGMAAGAKRALAGTVVLVGAALFSNGVAQQMVKWVPGGTGR